MIASGSGKGRYEACNKPYIGNGSFRVKRIGSGGRKSRTKEGGPLSVVDEVEYPLWCINFFHWDISVRRLAITSLVALIARLRTLDRLKRRSSSLTVSREMPGAAIDQDSDECSRGCVRRDTSRPSGSDSCTTQGPIAASRYLKRRLPLR